MKKKSGTKQKKVSTKKKNIAHLLRGSLWFFLGGILGLFFFISFALIIYRQVYSEKVYPGVFIGNTDFSGKTPREVKDFFRKKNSRIQKSLIIFSSADRIATTSASSLGLGYDADLLSNQAYSVGRGSDVISNASLIFQAYIRGLSLSPSYTVNEEKITYILAPFKKSLHIDAVDAKFTFASGRVTEFQTSSDGQDVDTDALDKQILRSIQTLIASQTPQIITITIPIKTIRPKITTESVNNMGIKELVATGTSLYGGSIPNRIYNVGLAASRINGVLIPPGEVFSFAKAVGDVSSLTGYKQAYVIENGKTVLGDGGGVCQVSTTLFRAALNAGLPIVERNPHAYRVHYYEEDSPPGIDAAVYVPSVDLKFKNDTSHYLLIQAFNNPAEPRLTFAIYGTKDNREVELTKPIITSQTPAPEPLYQDDPTLPKGEVKQVDFAAAGASVFFTRTVKKDNKIVIADKFVSHYRAWQAIYLRGTKE